MRLSARLLATSAILLASTLAAHADTFSYDFDDTGLLFLISQFRSRIRVRF
jgi:hypothetical protein